MKKTINSKQIGSMIVYTLLSLFLCMAGVGNASAAEQLNPVVKIDKTSYTSSGTEVTLRLWMFNWKLSALIKQYNARFTGNVYLYIDDKEVGNLKDMWYYISGSNYNNFSNIASGTVVGKSSDINLNGTNVGTAQFQDFKSGQTCPYNSNTTENSWFTVDLKLSFNKSFSYYGHKITVKGKWQDQSRGSLVTKDVALDNDINGFVRPINLKVEPSGDEMVLSWEKQSYNGTASDDGLWMVYKRENGERKKLGEKNVNDPTFRIAKSEHTRFSNYDVTFKPNIFNTTDTICGLTTSYIGTGHKLNDDGVCQYCNHSFFRYTTSDGKIVDNIRNKEQFGANIVAHSVVDGKCVIEFDGPITKIPKLAFNNNKSLTGDLVIPNSVKEIGYMAFNGCTGFNGTLMLSNKLETIRYNAFCDCTGFRGSLILPNSLTTIGKSAFSNCSGFTKLTLSNALSAIPEKAFANCTSLSGNLVIPNSVKEIGNNAFTYCRKFNGTLKLSNKLTTIGASAFSNCKGFTGSLILPNSLTTIGIMAFFGCKGFKDLTLSKALSVIPKEAFSDCSSLTGDLVIPNSVKEIGNSAFGYCTGFNGTLTLSNKLETIGRIAFLECSGFKGSLILPNSLTTIGELAFQECKGFTELTLPNALSVIPMQAFYGCKSLSGNLVIPASVKEIGKLAFNSCTALNGDSENPSQITLPESLEKIHDSVFRYCNNIKTIKFQSLPEGISKSIGAQKTVSLSDDSYISDKASGTVNEISYTRTMTSNWGTLVLPYPLTLTGNEPYRLYSIDNMTGEELVLKQLEGVVAAGTPCVVKRNGSEAELTFGANKAALKMAIDDQPVGGMTFHGTYWTKDVDNGYIIAKDCFWNVEKLKGVGSVKAVKVGPFRAWLDGTSANAPAQLSMRIDGSTTGIDAIDALNDAEAEYYDLSGKRLDEPQRGVNIVRMKSGKTKKIIIK